MTLSINARTASSMNLGYGAAAVNILISLSKLGVDISWFPIGNPYLTVNQHELVQQWIKNQDTFNPDNPSLSVWHENQLAERIGRGKNYALSFFELDTLNERRRTHLNSVDHIISPSSWAKSVMEKNDINIPITVVPMGVDIDIFQPQSCKQEDNYIFLAMGKWEIRKGHDILPEIFKQIFTEDDACELWMMCDNPFLTPEESQEWKNYYGQVLGERVKFIPSVRTDAELATIINKVDCGISLSRAEGFDLPLLQMMACEKQIIATNYSAHTEFCTKDNSQLIDITETEEAFDGKWFGPDAANMGRWAKIDTPQIYQCLHYIRVLLSIGKDAHNITAIETAQKFTWDICATKIKSLIESSL